ncbi:uncharacterized protein N7484_009989 [Penicillium longicatenatum]|uniref:uncharacterized protein n=1 Tax=Penicillium longicatenatum TaxID=1561947 RepID=UPI0025497D5B|nr:uncharacterized protein N7484_009989 [Penicillium longicatenatum]KAJ5636676.1 hypothetical protein N7484_009989 [Penicillium longicatenatum]
MPPRLNLFAAHRAATALRQSTVSSIAPRTAALSLRFRAEQSAPVQKRWNSSNNGSKNIQPDEQKFPTQDPLPSVTEEAAETSRIMEKEKSCDGTPSSPELEQGTPVEQILSRDEQARKHMPKVMQDQFKKPRGSRSFSTSARTLSPETQGFESSNDASVAMLASMIDQVNSQAAERIPGLIFEKPEAPTKTHNFRKRYDSMQDQFTKMLMQDGKLARAQKNMSIILDHLRTAPPPNINPRHPLLSGPPSSQLPLDPVLYLTLIVDSVAPLFRIRLMKGIAGGGAALQMPHPLTLRQRRRAAIKWIIDASAKRRDAQLAHRVANELVAVAEGRSGVWERRDGQHKIGIAGRANLGIGPRRRLTTSATHASGPPADQHLDLPGAPLYLPISFKRVPLTAQLPLPENIYIPTATVASSASRESFELADYNVTRQSGDRVQDSASALHRSTEPTSPPFEPTTSARPSAGLGIGQDFAWEKSPSSAKRPKGIRSTPLRFWSEALRRRAQKASRSNTALNPEAADKMKFSHSIQFNAVPDWSSHYIAYSNLKKLIYTLEKQVNRSDAPGGPDVESAPLLGAQITNPDGIFKRALDAELEKIYTFFEQKQVEIFQLTDQLMRDAIVYLNDTDGVNMDPVSETVIKATSRRDRSSFSRNGPGQRRRSSAISDEDGDSDDAQSASLGNLRHRPQSTDGESTTDAQPGDMADSAFFGQASSRGLPGSELGDQAFLDLYNNGVALKKRLVEAYVSLCELRSFIELNKTGFSKALKKYDKTLFRNMRREYLNSVVSQALPFTEETMATVDAYIDKIEGVYAEIVTRGNRSLASRELRLHLREQLVWERNTVWREMIAIERRGQALNVGIRQTLLGTDEDPETARRQGDKQEILTTEVSTPLGRIQFPLWFCSLSFGTLVLSFAVFGALLSLRIMDTPEQQNCLAMLVLVSILWSTEAIPLFVTSLLIPFLVVILGIMRSDDKPHKRLGPKEATSVVFGAMWTPVIMLLLGGFTIAAALSKYDIARRMAMFVLSKAGSKPHVVLLTNMFVSMFLSMWISNVASPVLCYSIIQPLLRNLPPESNFAKSLVLGIALAANVGGAASPIASPQNIIALQNMYPSISWGTWFFISLPVCIISILLIWGLLLVTFHPGRNQNIVPMRPVKDRFTGIQYFISAVTLGTIGLWCVSHQLEHIFGDMGVIAIIPLVLFFGTGILNKEDFNNFLWTIIILAAGGLCLGKAVTSSGLLHTIASGITARVEHLSLYSVLLVFCALILVIATFISHTVAALIILPLVRQIGVSMEDPHPNLLVMASALMCSVAMGLPTSGFPNMTAIMTEVPQTGQRYLHVRHFLSRGIPSSLMSFVVIVTIGYGLMVIAGL